MCYRISPFPEKKAREAFGQQFPLSSLTDFGVGLRKKVLMLHYYY